MIRDALRAALVVAVMAAAASILVEARFQMAAIDTAYRATLAGHYAPQMQTTPQEPGRLRRFGRATIDLADAALGVVR
jgi:hypothetical protein